MAPTGHAALGRRDAHPSDPSSLPVWLDKYGSSEYRAWQQHNPTEDLSYDAWTTSRHVDGLTLYYATLGMFEDSDSSDEATESLEVKPHARAVRGQSAREPKKKVSTNGNGLSRANGSATSSVPAASEDLSASGKKKRKARKKYLSEEIVASDGDSELEELQTSTPITETATPTAPTIAVNGRRKSSGRKASKKKILSEEIISPEDEIDDPMAMDNIVTPAIASPLPLRSGPKASTTIQSPGHPKKTILKLSTKKAPKKKVLSEETVLDDDTDDAKAPAPAPALTVTPAAEPHINASKTNIADDDADDDSNPDTHNAAAGTAAAGAATASTRRGLRTRRPAQKRPYFHDAQLFDEVEPEAGDVANPSPDAQSRRVSVASLGKGYDENILGELDEETITLLQEDSEPDPSDRRPKHFKGKGRAWKKEESDEDEEFTLAKKKAAKAAKAKAKGQAAAKKGRGRPRKSVLSEDIVRDESDSDAMEKEDGVSQTGSPGRTGREGPKKAKAKPRKSALSDEIARDDSESAAEADDHTMANTPAPEISTPVPKTRRLPRRSDQSTTPKSSTFRNEDVEEPLPNKSYTPQGTQGVPKKTEPDVASGPETEAQENNNGVEGTEVGKDEELVAASLSKKSVSEDEELCK